MAKVSMKSLEGKYPEYVVNKDTGYSRSTVANAMGLFDPIQNKIGIGYLPDASEAIGIGVSVLADKFLVNPFLAQYNASGGIWSYFLPFWYLKDLMVSELNATQGFVGPFVTSAVAGFAIKRLMLCSNRKGVLEHEKRHAAHKYVQDMKVENLVKDGRRIQSHGIYRVGREESKRFHDLEELITRTETNVDNPSRFSKYMVGDSIISSGILRPVQDVSRMGLVPALVAWQFANIPEWYSILMLGLYGISGFAPFSTRSNFPYVTNPVKRTKILRKTHKFVDCYIRSNSGRVPILPEDAEEKLKRKYGLMKKIIEDEGTLLEKGCELSTDQRHALMAYLQKRFPSMSWEPRMRNPGNIPPKEVKKWLIEEVEEYNRKVAEREFPRSVLPDYEKLERAILSTGSDYDSRSPYKLVKDGLSSLVKRIRR